MSVLSVQQRRNLDAGQFGIPEKAPGAGSYPLNDRSHAHAALSELHNASPEEQHRIRAKIHRLYPDIVQRLKNK